MKKKNSMIKIQSHAKPPPKKEPAKASEARDYSAERQNNSSRRREMTMNAGPSTARKQK